ncbi:LegC family aminotransferase [Arcicella sp. LKC2W]|uniref:LegC family aminotransferase n=1 Tax=Arcicella sp. LKC2W TaxID=2984198 RepID=UPI002B21BA52|nr:LegC family aminotransferase [Arcicella sp. LKC2W]MEA5459180.1 LegC family aminotransferase [Arcicella sp. LKC2W]
MIPLSVPNLAGNEWEYIKDCLDTNWVSSVGSYVNRFEQALADFTGAKYAIATSNGTSALHIGLQLSGVKQGDLVIVPNITFVATANAVKYTGASPLLIDIDTDTWQIDLDLLENFLSNNTKVIDGETYHTDNQKRIKAIMPVHVLGNMCDMERLMEIANRFHLQVIEDSTEALGSTFNGKHAGTFGLFGTSSFNGNKIITTGGGGMILTNDENLAKRAKHITTTAKADAYEYFHDEVGYNYRLVNILAAMGVAQMEQLPAFLIRKKAIADLYNAELLKIEGIIPQKITDGVQANHWLYTVKAPRQKELLTFLGENGIQARPFWVPMNRLPFMSEEIYITENDVAGNIYGQCVSLPCSTNITDSEVLEVIRLIQQFYGV